MKEWYYLEEKERQKQKERIKKHYNIQSLEELKDFFNENVEYCQKINHINLNYWLYELDLMNECINELKGV